VQRKLFWNLALTFVALLLSVLLADFLAERALRSSYENNAYSQLKSIASLLPFEQLHLANFPPQTAEETTALNQWVAAAASKSGARISVISADGRVIADSESETQTMETHADRPEVRQALQSGEGRAMRQSVSVKRPLLYYAVRRTMANNVPAVLRLALPLEGLGETLGTFRARLWVWSFFIFFLAGAVALLTSRSYTDRIERLREFSRRVAEGDFRPISSDGTGDTLEALGYSLNQTAARLDRTIQTLTEERNLSSAILGSMVEGVAVVNGAERLVFANPGFASILGLDVPPVSGSALLEVVRQTELIEAVRRVLAGEPRVEAEIATGTLRQHYFAATVASVRAGETSGAVIVLHDITELRKLERIRRDFVANVSHEFRTPLTAIQGFSETLLGGAMNDPQNRERFLGIILEHARRLARLTEDLLRLSQMDADRLELELRQRQATHRVVLRDRQPPRGRKRARGLAGSSNASARCFRRRAPAARSSAKPPRQRHPVHSAWWKNSFERGYEERGSDPDRQRYGHRHSASRSAAHLRALLSRGRGALPRGRRHGPRLGDCQASH